MKLAVAAVVALLVIAIGGAAYLRHKDQEAERQAVAAAKANMKARVLAYHDSFKVAMQTPRIGLGAVMLRLSDDTRAVKDMVPPPCLTLAHTRSYGAVTEGPSVLRKMLDDMYDSDEGRAFLQRAYDGYARAIGDALGEIDASCLP